MTRNRNRVPTGEEFDRVTGDAGRTILRFFKLARKIKLGEGVAEGKKIAQVPPRETSAQEATPAGPPLAVQSGDVPAQSRALGAVAYPAARPSVSPEARAGDPAPSRTPAPPAMNAPRANASPSSIDQKPTRKITIAPRVMKQRAAARVDPGDDSEQLTTWEKGLSMEEMHRRIGPPQQYGDDF